MAYKNIELWKTHFSGEHGRGTLKDRAHRAGRRAMRDLVDALGLVEGTYAIRSSYGGVAVSGEVVLHTAPIGDSGVGLYVMLGSSLGVMFRRCKGLADYTGGANHYARLEEALLDPVVVRQFAQQRLAPLLRPLPAARPLPVT